MPSSPTTQPALRSLHPYVQAARKLTRELFLEEYPRPVLVVEPFRILDDTGVETLNVQERAPGTAWTVGLVAKRPGANAFASMITIGRARNNDIEIKAAEISKFHAYLMLRGDEVTLTDAGSTNGTFVRGNKLEPRATKDVVPGDRLRLGGIGATFHSPDSLWEFLQDVVEDPSILEMER